jgi:hypothetical protein
MEFLRSLNSRKGNTMSVQDIARCAGDAQAASDAIQRLTETPDVK